MARNQKDPLERYLTLLALVAGVFQGFRMYRKIKNWGNLIPSPTRTTAAASTPPERPAPHRLGIRETWKVISTAEYFFELEEGILSRDRSQPAMILVMGLTRSLDHDPRLLEAFVERVNTRGRRKGYEISLATIEPYTETIAVHYL